MTALGIESSCDDTSVSILRHSQGSQPEILSLVVKNQDRIHEAYGGIVPEIAARAHSDYLDRCTIEALKEADMTLDALDLIAVTAGPGLIGGVLSGVSFAKGLASGAGLPLVGVNHLAAHALTPRMTSSCSFPYLCLLVSGGHCQFLAVVTSDTFIRLGGTIDDAPGEAFDKTARHLGLRQAGGPQIELMARRGKSDQYKFPRPLTDREGCNLSFSGLKTALLREVEKISGATGKLSDQQRADLCASFQKAVSDTLSIKSCSAISAFMNRMEQSPTVFALAGGVAANETIRDSVKLVCRDFDLEFYAPPQRYCTDNGAMIAWAGLESFRLGKVDGMDLQARSRWPLDTTSDPLLGAGKRGAKA